MFRVHRQDRQPQTRCPGSDRSVSRWRAPRRDWRKKLCRLRRPGWTCWQGDFPEPAWQVSSLRARRTAVLAGRGCPRPRRADNRAKPRAKLLAKTSSADPRRLRRKSGMPRSIQESAGPRAAVEPENRATRPDQEAIQRKKIDLRPIRSYCKYRYCKGLVEDRVASGIDRGAARVVFLNTTVSVVLASNLLRWAARACSNCRRRRTT